MMRKPLLIQVRQVTPDTQHEWELEKENTDYEIKQHYQTLPNLSDTIYYSYHGDYIRYTAPINCLIDENDWRELLQELDLTPIKEDNLEFFYDEFEHYRFCYEGETKQITLPDLPIYRNMQTEIIQQLSKPMRKIMELKQTLNIRTNIFLDEELEQYLPDEKRFHQKIMETIQHKTQKLVEQLNHLQDALTYYNEVDAYEITTPEETIHINIHWNDNVHEQIKQAIKDYTNITNYEIQMERE